MAFDSKNFEQAIFDRKNYYVYTLMPRLHYNSLSDNMIVWLYMMLWNWKMMPCFIDQIVPCRIEWWISSGTYQLKI